MDIVESLLKVALLGSAWVLYLLLALSVASIGAILERWWFFRRHRDDQDRLRKRVSEALLAQDLPQARKVLGQSRSFEAGIINRALDWQDGGPGAVADAVDAELSQLRKSLEKGASFLGTLGNNAPFIGLFGTVIGVIEAFHHLAGGAASKTAMGNVMSGIAEALVATGVGIFVAIPAVVAFNVIQKKIGELESATNALAKLITAYLKTVDRSGGKLIGTAARIEVENTETPPEKTHTTATTQPA